MVYAYSLSCQYTSIEEYSEEELRFYRGSELLEGKLEIQETQFGCPDARFKVYNPFDFEVEVCIDYLIASNWFGSKKISLSTVIPSNEYKILEGRGSCDTRKVLGYVKFKIVAPEDLTSKLEKVTKQKIICKKCNAVACLDDGSPCTIPKFCGGGFCVEGHCSNSEFCFNNDCKCNADEIQCDDNKICVKKSVVPIYVKPVCGLYQECVSQYINPETGLCEKSPAQIQEEENQKLKDEMERQERIQEEEHQRLMDELAQKEKEKNYLVLLIMGLAFLIINGWVVIYILKKKHEKEKQRTIETKTSADIIVEEAKQKTIETKTSADIIVEEAKQKTIQKEIELVGRRIQTKEHELNKLNNQIKEMKRQKHKSKQKIEELENLKSEGDELIRYIENQYEKITKPFPDSQACNRLVVINPYLGGYKCFYDKGVPLENYPFSSLVHRWVWKENHDGKYPERGFHIHHIDHDKYNNDLKNLELVDGKEHYEMHRMKYWG